MTTSDHAPLEDDIALDLDPPKPWSADEIEELDAALGFAEPEVLPVPWSAGEVVSPTDLDQLAAFRAQVPDVRSQISEFCDAIDAAIAEEIDRRNLAGEHVGLTIRTSGGWEVKVPGPGESASVDHERLRSALLIALEAGELEGVGRAAIDGCFPPKKIERTLSKRALNALSAASPDVARLVEEHTTRTAKKRAATVKRLGGGDES